MIATASLIIPSPNNTAFRTGYFSGLINDMAATVSVAQSTLPTINTYSVVRTLKIHLLSKYRMRVMPMKPIIVPTMPKKLIIPKF